MKNRTPIYNGNRWIRWIMLLVILWQIAGFFDDAPFAQVDVLVLLIAILLFLVFWVLRRVNFDEENIYRVYGKKEKAVALTSITRIEKTGMRFGKGGRYWRLRYADQDGREQKFLFKEGTFQSGSIKALFEAVQKVNPGVEIEKSHIWNQVELQKRRKANRKAKKEAGREGNG